MIKQIIKRFFEWVFLSVIFILLNLIIDNLIYGVDWPHVGAFLLGYFICLLVRLPYNKEEIELDNYIEKNNKNGFD